ncbi:unnamed protein product, partial [Prorocentrum cordatum]
MESLWPKRTSAGPWPPDASAARAPVTRCEPPSVSRGAWLGTSVSGSAEEPGWIDVVRDAEYHAAAAAGTPERTVSWSTSTTRTCGGSAPSGPGPPGCAAAASRRPAGALPSMLSTATSRQYPRWPRRAGQCAAVLQPLGRRPRAPARARGPRGAEALHGRVPAAVPAAAGEPGARTWRRPRGRGGSHAQVGFPRRRWRLGTWTEPSLRHRCSACGGAGPPPCSVASGGPARAVGAMAPPRTRPPRPRGPH